MKFFEDHGDLLPFQNRATRMYFGDTTPTAFDIETMGLSPRRNPLILTGILKTGPDGYHAMQVFAEKPVEEEAVIRETLARLAGTKLLLTFNGRGFDLPYFSARAKQYGLGEEAEKVFSQLYHLDLYQLVRNYSPLAEVMPSLNQKSVERMMGIDDHRMDEIGGGESVKEYEEYVLHPTKEAEDRILLHNHDDIVQLARLLPILKRVHLHDAMQSLGFPAGEFFVRETKVHKDSLDVKFSGIHGLKEYIAFPQSDRPYHLVSSASKNLAEVHFSLEKIAPGTRILDVQGILGETPVPASFDRLPAYSSGYLVLKKGDPRLAMEVNAFLILFLRSMNWLAVGNEPEQ